MNMMSVKVDCQKMKPQGLGKVVQNLFVCTETSSNLDE